MKNKVTDLRNHLFEQIERLQDETLDFEQEVKRANAISHLAKQIIDSAKAEANFLRLMDAQPGTDFIPHTIPGQPQGLPPKFEDQ